MRQNEQLQNKVLYFLGIIPTIWLALIIAPNLNNGLMSIITGFTESMNNPLNISWCENSIKSILIFLLIYIMIIAVYESKDRAPEFDAPREYALSQQHKHLKEMTKITGLQRTPLFSPMVCDYYSGMIVTLPLYTDLLNGKPSLQEVQEKLAAFYEGEPFIQVMPLGSEDETNGFLAGNARSGWDGLEIFVTGNEDRILLSSRFDNLGKGASGAAIQCMNIVMGVDEKKGLNL